jgi:hypothetical protein
LEPDTCSIAFPFVTTTFPAIVALDRFMVNPFFVIASLSCFKVAVLPAFIVTDASPFSRLTSTESTPETDLRDTRTACAQTSQSIPKIVMSMELISAEAETATIVISSSSSEIVFLISVSPHVSVGTAGS